LLAEFERCTDLLALNPSIGATWRGEWRRLPMRRFPLNVVYVVQGSELTILAVAHQRRKPGYWRSRPR
jgi:plasmid stabilization system protein ParE